MLENTNLNGTGEVFKPVIVSIDYMSIESSKDKLKLLVSALNQVSGQYKALMKGKLTLSVLLELIAADKKPFISPNGRHFDADKFYLKKADSPDLDRLLKLKFANASTDLDNLKLSGVSIDAEKFIGLISFPSIDELKKSIRDISGCYFNWSKLACNKLIASDFSNIFTGEGFDGELITDQLIDFYTLKTSSQFQNDLISLLVKICDNINGLGEMLGLNTEQVIKTIGRDAIINTLIKYSNDGWGVNPQVFSSPYLLGTPQTPRPILKQDIPSPIEGQQNLTPHEVNGISYVETFMDIN